MGQPKYSITWAIHQFEPDFKEFPARTTTTTDFIDEHCLIQVHGVAYRR